MASSRGESPEAEEASEMTVSEWRLRAVRAEVVEPREE